MYILLNMKNQTACGVTMSAIRVNFAMKTAARNIFGTDTKGPLSQWSAKRTKDALSGCCLKPGNTRAYNMFSYKNPSAIAGGFFFCGNRNSRLDEALQPLIGAFLSILYPHPSLHRRPEREHHRRVPLRSYKYHTMFHRNQGRLL